MVKTKVYKTPGFGCSECVYRSDMIAHHAGDVTNREYHCYECNGLYIIDYKTDPSRCYQNHNHDKRNSKGICNFMKGAEFTCAICEYTFPLYPHAIRTYKSIYGGNVDLQICLGCNKQIGAPLQEQRGWKYAPMWVWGLAAGTAALSMFVVIPMTGQELNLGGVIGSLAIPGYMVYKWKA